ncbi:hypothetical protein L292_0550 [Acinetobacter junii CIP 107470 = MTCC 11364]|uniref:Uncharacterized protein n=1 Tax=Acinetobacter junii CIP 107470 = MTCC 11364 TaxID=1217666 RepID=S7WMI9_ACIJU|nr:hypothetical protein [Acinetobacter junii]ENV52047.1 hypothetical protein F953_00537 [Acinetobacter junii CIP 107470 = MTCC 11364]EPR83072.1 hypothetical protein L292_0550 [Acinetobacter junii CIP 107470 = MTCC 11364]
MKQFTSGMTLSDILKKLDQTTITLKKLDERIKNNSNTIEDLKTIRIQLETQTTIISLIQKQRPSAYYIWKALNGL